MRIRAPRSAPTFAALFLLAGLFAVPHLAAQQGAQDPGSRTQARKAEKIPQQDLDHFADAYLAISQLRQSVKQKLQNAGSKKERQNIQTQANQKMASIIKDNGLTIQRYQKITQTLNKDQSQRQAFAQLMQKKRGGSGDDTGGGS